MTPYQLKWIVFDRKMSLRIDIDFRRFGLKWGIPYLGLHVHSSPPTHFNCLCVLLPKPNDPDTDREQ